MKNLAVGVSAPVHTEALLLEGAPADTLGAVRSSPCTSHWCTVQHSLSPGEEEALLQKRSILGQLFQILIGIYCNFLYFILIKDFCSWAAR